ncbi:hypothetical protein EJ05DRAFT_499508 [Pseudovirgaria hyperparasitica]|uniref:Inositol-pentakisphosphate 2-kinase n=1 Tax=Pseudovirgaria hyperparasitica TaxID=470096 RepID=A0A6A6WAM3_9PEZI|nr:uncharacterized protein EJ05DRAFT_499508 [Pseudovirgaria hyperparasitica]KAF2759084.1 hypothetical protein EJ05DRAFT_499508 [Pseudovirgaria hyperparasitica]
MSVSLIQLEPIKLGQQSFRYFGLKLIDEGAANVVYKLTELFPGDIRSTSSDTSPKFMVSSSIAHINFTRMLLRVRKAAAENVETQCDIVDKLNNLIPSHHIVQMIPVQASSELLSALNSDLLTRERQRRRPQIRCGSMIEETNPTVVLVEDMSAESTMSFTVEFKPKWLVQSPDAPKDAIRCRTCALRAMKLLQSRDGKLLTKVPPFCPLELVEGKQDFVRHAMSGLLLSAKLPYERGSSNYEAVLKDLVHYFSDGNEGNKLLHSIRKAQQHFSPGPFRDLPELNQDRNTTSIVTVKKLEAAVTTMTLRDVSLFLRYTFSQSKKDGSVIEAKLADLDKKSIDKISSWKDTELKLQSGGYYANKEPNAVFEKICLLSRPRQQGYRAQDMSSELQDTGYSHVHRSTPSTC